VVVLLSGTLLPKQHRPPFSSFDRLAVRPDHQEAVRSRDRRNVARTLPGCEFDLSIFELARNPSRKESLEARLGVNALSGLGMQTLQRRRADSCQRLDEYISKKCEGDHGRDGVSGKAKEVLGLLPWVP